MIHKLAIANYRSIRDLVVPLGQLNLITGPNGSGKSNLYRALRLLADTAQGRIVSSLAAEGGFESTLWAGPEEISRSMLRGDHPVQGARRKKPINLKLGFVDDQFGYSIDLGLPTPSSSMFSGDAQIKRECLWHGEVLRPSCLFADRSGALVRVRGSEGEWMNVTASLPTFDSMMTSCSDPRATPEIFMLRESIRAWRFYDTVRTDAQAPARTPQIGTYSPVLDDSGANLAAAVRTIQEIGEAEAFAQAVNDAFPRSSVQVSAAGGRFELEMSQYGLLRPLKSAELSDGTLRYIILIAALLTPRPPLLMVLNEPESSLHPDLLPALARLITRVSTRTQVIVVSHAQGLIDELSAAPGRNLLRLDKRLGETRFEGQDEYYGGKWEWPAR